MKKSLTTNEMSNAIISGDRSAIIRGISYDSEIVRLNALIYGAKFNIHDKDFISAVKDIASRSDVSFFGVPFKSYAAAALDVLNVKKYNGKDDFILKLISSKFNF